jgi:hypothetical protein
MFFEGGERMKKVFALLLVLCCSSWLRADLLDDVSRQLDLLEKEYWRSQHSSQGDYRSGVEKRLQAMVSNVNKISVQLRKMRLQRIADISSPAITLQMYYGKVRIATIKRFNLSFKGSSMRDYTREFRALQAEKEAAKAAEEAEKDKTGKSKRSRSRRSSSREVPTLKNVDMVEYERWLAEIVAENMDKFLSKKHNGSDSERDKMNDMVSSYFSAIKNLRMGLVKTRQQTKTEFK